MPHCEPKVLYQAHRLCISHCQHCQRVSVLYFNLLVGFSPTEFDNFCRNVLDAQFDKHATQFSDEEPTIVLRTCHDDIQFAFTRHEFEHLQQTLATSQLLREAQHLLANASKN